MLLHLAHHTDRTNSLERIVHVPPDIAVRLSGRPEQLQVIALQWSSAALAMTTTHSANIKVAIKMMATRGSISMQTCASVDLQVGATPTKSSHVPAGM